jgi:hypothetical protein
LDEDFQVIRYSSPTVITSPPLGEVTVIHRVAAFKSLELVAETGKDGQASAKATMTAEINRTTLRDITPSSLLTPPALMTLSSTNDRLYYKEMPDLINKQYLVLSEKHVNSDKNPSR